MVVGTWVEAFDVTSEVRAADNEVVEVAGRSVVRTYAVVRNDSYCLYFSCNGRRC
jgi:hypothetical protein